VANVAYTFLTFSTLGTLPHAHFKIKVRDTFLLQGPRTDFAISVVQNQAWVSLSTLYCLTLIASTPFLVRFTRSQRLLVPALVLLALAAPLWWYFEQVSHVAMKLVDWNQILGPPPDTAATRDCP
jgi:hypothetical protein